MSATSLFTPAPAGSLAPAEPLETLTACPVCQAHSFRDKLQVPDRSVSQETFTIVQCQQCGFQFTNPRPDAAHIGRYYESPAYVSHNSEAGDS